MWCSRVDVQGRVQGFKLSQQTILRDASNMVFTATKTFTSSVHISGTLNPNPVDLSALCGKLVEFENLKIIGNVNFLGNVRAGVVHIDEHVISGGGRGAGVGYWLVDRDVVLEKAFRFADVESLKVTALRVNGVDLRHLFASCLKRDCVGSQKVTGIYEVSSMTITTVLTTHINVSMTETEKLKTEAEQLKRKTNLLRLERSRLLNNTALLLACFLEYIFTPRGHTSFNRVLS